MTLTLYFHPLASFCHKVLIALYEKEIPFKAHQVDLMDETERARFLDLWPLGKMPLLHDGQADRTIPETTIIIEYLEQSFPATRPLLSATDAERLEARLWDRFFDLYVQVPMQKIVADRRRPEGANDPHGVAEARAALGAAYAMIERRMADRRWAVDESFGLADCAAAPALFYAGIVEPFTPTHPAVAAYFERLLERPSFSRVIDEARPSFHLFPFRDDMPERFLTSPPTS